MVAVDRPIFLIGTGRCGSSLLYRLLGYHPRLAWVSHHSSYLPGGGRWSALARLHDLPGLAALQAQQPPKWVPQPTENYRLLNAATDGLFTRPGRLTADDMTPTARKRLRALVAEHTRARGVARFALKHTGFPRTDYLLAAFPDARFVHVRRDGRAVAASLCKVGWWSGEGHWGWGALSEADRTAYRDSGFHELVLAGLYWKVLMRHLAEALPAVPEGQLLDLRYDALVADPVGTMHTVAAFCDLGTDPRFDARLKATPMTSDDTRWRRSLTEEEQLLIQDLLAIPLAQHGFA